jgi:hypothetical protein
MAARLDPGVFNSISAMLCRVSLRAAMHGSAMRSAIKIAGENLATGLIREV